MPENQNLGGMSDFGLVQPSQGTSVDQNPLAELLGNAVFDELGRSRLITQQMDQLRSGAGDQTYLQRLLSPQGIVPLIAGGLAAALGQPGLGAGIGLGGLQGVAAAEEAERAQRMKAMEDLNDKYEQSLDRQDKARNRFTQLLQSQPDLFMTPEGEPTVDARVLGWYATGAPIPLFPDAKRALDRADFGWEKMQEMLFKSLSEASSVDQQRAATRLLLRHQGMDNPPEERISAIVQALGTPDLENEAVNTLLKYGGTSGLSALIYAGENNLSAFHPEVLKRVIFKDPDDVTPSQQLNARFLELMDTVNNWQQDPANAQEVLQIQKNAKGDEAEASRAIVGRALEGRQADIDFYLDKANVPEGLTQAIILRAYSTVASGERAADAVRGARDLPRQRGLTPEQVREERGQKALGLIEEARKLVEQTQGNRDAAMRNNSAVNIQRELGWSVQSTYSLVDQIFNAALQDAPRDAEGNINREAFEVLFDQYTKLAIQQNKE